MAERPWIVSDELWELIEPLLPAHPRRFRYPGRKRLPDRPALCGILFVLHTGIAWRHLPPELGFGSGITCWRRLDEWQRAGVWDELHALLLARLRAADQLDFSRAVADSSHVQATKGAYCAPRENQGPWHEVEVGFPSSEPEFIMQFAEQAEKPTETVYGYVPVELVEKLVDHHGGPA